MNQQPPPNPTPFMIRWFAPWRWLPWQIWLTIGVLMAMYVGPYYALSRRGYHEADQWNADGFYYFTPDPTRRWYSYNLACKYIFWPINAIDRAIGTGRYPSNEPMWDLE